VTNLCVKVVRHEQEFATLGDQWQQLAACDEQANLFNDWSWNSVWWSHYKHLGSLHVVLVYREEQLVGIGPFYRGRSKAMGLGKIDTLRFLGTGGDTSPDDLNIIAHPDLRHEIARVLCDHLFNEQFQRMLLADVTQQSPFYEAFVARSAITPGYAQALVTHTRRYADLPTDWDGFRGQISRNTHKQIKRRQNRLNALEHVQVKRCTTEQEVEIAFESLVRLHVSRWQSKGHCGSFGSDNYRQFHQALMWQLYQRDQLWLITLEIDEEIVAVEYAFLYKNTLLFFQTGFNPDFEHLSPGHILMTYAIKHAIESGVQRIDLLKGDYEYKSSYANQELSCVDVGFYEKSIYSFMAKMKDQRLEYRRTMEKKSNKRLEIQ